MRIESKTLMKLGGLGLCLGVCRWMSTLDSRIACYDDATDPIHAEFRGPVIFVFWHEYLLLPVWARGNCNAAMLLSRHRDAQWLAEVARHLGYDTIRGSTYRGAAVALRRLFRQGRSKNSGITPDGPRGPRRQFAQGAIYLSSRLQLPLVLCGVGYDRPWRMSTWDRFAVPRPFSRARILLSPAVQLPRRLDRDGLEHYRRQMEQLLNRLTWEAEAWAVAGTRKTGERTFAPYPRPPFIPRPLPGEPARGLRLYVPAGDGPEGGALHASSRQRGSAACG